MKIKAKKILTIGFFISMTAALAGCSGGSTYVPEKADPYSYTSTYRDMRISGTGYSCEAYSTFYNEEGKKKYEITNMNVLVVPVDIPDSYTYDAATGTYVVDKEYSAEHLPGGKDYARECIVKATSADSDGITWESLKSYYNKSSFGQCNINVTVTDWWTPKLYDEYNDPYAPSYKYLYDIAYNTRYYDIATGEGYYAKELPAGTKTSDYLEVKGFESYGTEGATKMLSELQSYYKYGCNTDGVDLNDFDANNDKYVDCLIMVYSRPETTTGELWWAFCSTRSISASNSQKNFSRFFWASYNFFYEGCSAKEYQSCSVDPDAHTLVHEFGHVLGLPDYYVTDYNKSDYDGTGGLDMESYNVGDHNAASKAWYGWTEPTVVEKPCTIKLRSTTDTGDFFIIPDSDTFSGTLLSQFLMVEFLTPTGVTTYDSVHAYANGYPLWFSEAGVRITQVDARLGLWKYNSTAGEWQFGGFTNNYTHGNSEYVGLANTNTANTSGNSKYKLIKTWPATGTDISGYKYSGNNNSILWKAGDTFGDANHFPDFCFNSTGNKIDREFKYKITILDIGTDDEGAYCTVKVAKK